MKTFGEMKFNFGDKVRILKNPYNGRFNIGDIGIVKFVSMVTKYQPYQIEIDGQTHWYDDNELELIEDVESKFKLGDWVRTVKCESVNDFKRFEVDTVCAVHEIDDKNPKRYRIYNGDEHRWYNEDELELVEYITDDATTDSAKKKDTDHKFKVGDVVIVENTFVGSVTDFNIRNYQYEVTLIDDSKLWVNEDTIKLFDWSTCEPPNKPCSDVQRNITVEEVEKLEEELRRKDSELRDLKELIIKLLFDRYGF